jgi:hypothetical protein
VTGNHERLRKEFQIDPKHDACQAMGTQSTSSGNELADGALQSFPRFRPYFGIPAESWKARSEVAAEFRSA